LWKKKTKLAWVLGSGIIPEKHRKQTGKKAETESFIAYTMIYGVYYTTMS